MSDVQREYGSGRGLGPRPAIRDGAFQPLSWSVRARGALVVMDCQRQSSSPPPGYMLGDAALLARCVSI